MLVDWEWSTACHRFDERFWLKRMSMGPSKEENEKLHQTQWVRESENQQKIAKKNNTHINSNEEKFRCFFLSPIPLPLKNIFHHVYNSPAFHPCVITEVWRCEPHMCLYTRQQQKKNQQDVKQRAKNHKSKSDQPKRNWATKKKEKSPPRCGKFNYREKQPFLKLRMSCKYFLVNIFLFSSHSFSALVHTFVKYAKI